MKSLTIVVLLVAATVALARIIVPFYGWEKLESDSPTIAIINCGKATPPYPVIDGPASDFTVNIVAMLKGNTNIISARLWTDYHLTQGENYLVFGYCNDGIYRAYEKYRIIPLGVAFQKSSIAGKPLNEQLQVLFKAGIEHMNLVIQEASAERERLEEGLKANPH